MTSTLITKTQAYVDGQWVSSASGKTLAVLNPANGEHLADVPDMSAEEASAAVEAAHKAFASWKKTTAKARAQMLRRWYELIMDNQERLARLMTAEQGKPLAEARGEVAYGASFAEWFAEEGKRAYGEHIPSPSPTSRIVTIRQPIGVVAAITPWNFPLAMITRKIAPALAAGCTVVLKPAEDTPLSALELAALAEEAGFPAGVINIVTTTDPVAVGDTLTSHPLVSKVSFTGSTPVGKHILHQAADTVKKVSLELGGNAPFIVFEDADLDAAVKGLLISKYRNAGQTCVCTNRIYVQRSVVGPFVEKFKAAVSELKVGAGDQDGVEIGPLINKKAIDRVDQVVKDAVGEGAELVLGGKRSSAGELFYEPTLLSGVTEQMAIANQELFGPISTLFVFDDEEDVIERANATPFGLAAYFYSRDIGRCWRVGEGLEYGMVGINEGIISNEVAPFGGVKESGLGREGSKHGLDDYLEIKYLCMGGI
ncbi:NAD-dependent succinate-semialdehyde dehydrogenase [Marinobacterium mangrovicola]|uniref:Succinate-semialdehyde dehydrogenase/glutarate-semialdehyde dehydrogenase n=1 Tax=Marinobacterium mangrovicola TaxID=1476959 RepID=A0A4R1GIR9_9GAMM|nr:NAD-dependent succinate-semialdehyde dehydrogenase [Marinobacterium mangrovicola]TCK05819.1 succinate-semialdehyde dehydrogenase/glutarate-semialdehyde dehydrogenase [Marinobacterium mangrovicola]